MSRNIAYFDELEFKKYIADFLRQDFTDIDIIDSFSEDYTDFPCIYIQVLSTSVNDKFSNSTEVQQFTNVTFDIDIYARDNETYSKTDNAIFISQQVINCVQQNIQTAMLVYNQALPNLDTLTARKKIRFNCVIDNLNKIIYSN